MSNLYSFIGGHTGSWQIVGKNPIRGADINSCSKLDIVEGYVSDKPKGSQWLFRGFTSNLRYTTKAEKTLLDIKQAATTQNPANAALILIKKNPAWWSLAQDERRAIFEESSHHTSVGLKYLPAIDRRLYHSRDLDEPFDFITWFQYVPAHIATFNELLFKLRLTEEWKYVEHEIDIRLIRT